MDAALVLDTAERICRAEGIEHLSVRRLAGELHASRSTVHDLIGSSAELNELLRGRAAGEIAALLGGSDWTIAEDRDVGSVAKALLRQVEAEPEWSTLGLAVTPAEGDPFGLGTLGASVGVPPRTEMVAASVRRIWLRAIVRWMRSGEAEGRSALAEACLETLYAAEPIVEGRPLRGWPEPAPVVSVLGLEDVDALIVAACRMLIRSEGAEAVTIRRIADLTFLGKSTVHHRVGGHDQLVLSLRRRARGDFWDAATEAGAQERWSLATLSPAIAARVLRSDPMWLLYGMANAGDRLGSARDDPADDSWSGTRHLMAEMVWPVALLVVLAEDDVTAAGMARCGIEALLPAMEIARRHGDWNRD